MLKPLREFTRFMRWMQHGARWLPTFGPSRLAWTISPPVGCQLTTLTIASLTVCCYSAHSWYSFYSPTEGRRLSRPRWLHTKMIYPPVDSVTHPGTNRTRRRVTTLIKTNALPPRHQPILIVRLIGTSQQILYNSVHSCYLSHFERVHHLNVYCTLTSVTPFAGMYHWE